MYVGRWIGCVSAELFLVAIEIAVQQIQDCLIIVSLIDPVRFFQIKRAGNITTGGDLHVFVCGVVFQFERETRQRDGTGRCRYAVFHFFVPFDGNSNNIAIRDIVRIEGDGRISVLIRIFREIGILNISFCHLENGAVEGKSCLAIVISNKFQIIIHIQGEREGHKVLRRSESRRKITAVQSRIDCGGHLIINRPILIQHDGFA